MTRVAAGFERVAEAFTRQLGESGALGAGFCAIQNGVTLVDLWGGHADRARSLAWEQDTLVPIYSATKPIAALTLARLIDSDGLDFDAPVASLWPEFGAHGKDALTIAEWLSHQGGLPGFAEPIDTALWLDPPALAAELAQRAPMWAPGTANGYHPTTWGYAVGEIFKRASGRSLGEALREDICAPHDIDFWIGLPDSEHARVAEIKRPSKLPDLGPLTPVKRAAFLEKWASPDRGGAEWRRVEIPSANGHCTARALARLMSIYAQSGAYEVETVLSARAFGALAMRRRFEDDLVLPFKLDWRAGVLGNNLGFFGPDSDALGHYGWGGSCGMADGARGLSIGYVTNAQSHHLMGDPRAVELIEAVYACL